METNTVIERELQPGFFSGEFQNPGFTDLVEHYQHFKRSINSAEAWVLQTRLTLENLAGLFFDVFMQGVELLCRDYSKNVLDSFAGKIESMVIKVVEVLNTKSGDEYLFSGSRSTIKPFRMIGVDLYSSDSAGVSYEGSPCASNRGNRSRQIAPEMTIDIGFNGEEVWIVRPGGQPRSFTITECIVELASALRNGHPDSVNECIKRLSLCREHIADLIKNSELLEKRLTMLSEQLDKTLQILQEKYSKLFDLRTCSIVDQLRNEQFCIANEYPDTISILKTTLMKYQ